MSVRCYVAASSRELDRARRVMDALRLHGAEVVSTWVEAIEAVGAANEGLSPAARKHAAETCLQEVASADVLLLLVPDGPSGIGCGVELGYAMAWRGKRIIAAGRTERTIFAALCDEEHASDLEGIAAVVRLAREGVE